MIGNVWIVDMENILNVHVEIKFVKLVVGKTRNNVLP